MGYLGPPGPGPGDEGPRAAGRMNETLSRAGHGPVPGADLALRRGRSRGQERGRGLPERRPCDPRGGPPRPAGARLGHGEPGARGPRSKAAEEGQELAEHGSRVAHRRPHRRHLLRPGIRRRRATRGGRLVGADRGGVLGALQVSSGADGPLAHAGAYGGGAAMFTSGAGPRRVQAMPSIRPGLRHGRDAAAEADRGESSGAFRPRGRARHRASGRRPDRRDAGAARSECARLRALRRINRVERVTLGRVVVTEAWQAGGGIASRCRSTPP